MKNITAEFAQFYKPQKALLIYQSKADKHKVHVEAYDIDQNGKPINAHPLSVLEINELAECLHASVESGNQYLAPQSLIPPNILYVDNAAMGYAVWYSPAKQVQLLFKEKLGIPSGKAYVPALLWKATRDDLYIYAIKTNKRPTGNTVLYHAPFFNIYEDGKTCMGTVDIDINESSSLEDFTRQWESYFWNSYFSHCLEGFIPVKKNIVQIWHQQVKTERMFPSDILLPSRQTIKDIIT